MEHDIDLTGYIDGSLSRTERDKIAEHLKTCHECRVHLENLQKSFDLFSRVLNWQPDFCDALIMNKQTDNEIDLKNMTPLPKAIKQLISKKKQRINERLAKALFVLKTLGKGAIQDMADEIESLVSELLSSNQEAEMFHALKKDITMPSMTEIELRSPTINKNEEFSADTDEEFSKNTEFSINDFTIEIKKLTSRIQIRIIRGKKPVSGIEIKIKKKPDETIILKTDENGIAFLDEISF